MIIKNVHMNNNMGKIIAGPASDFPEGTTHKVTLDGRDIAVTNIGGVYYAVDDTCTHAGASLADGRLDGCNLVCGWHGAEFDCTTGKLAKFPATIPGLTSYTTSEEDGNIYVEVS